MATTVTSLRLPDDLREALKSIARSEERSVHSLIIVTLREMVAERLATPSRG